MSGVNTSFRAYKYLQRVIQYEQEEFWALALTSAYEIIDMKRLFLGTVDSCNVHPRDIFRFAIEKNASRLIIAHCHPNGNPSPSFQDIKLTKRITRAARLLGIPLIDHIILTRHSYSSMADDKLL